MTRHSNHMKVKSVSGREEDDWEIEEAPIYKETIGRPAWWFTGSLFKPRTMFEQTLGTLQYQTLAQNNPVLSSRAQRIRRYIGILSKWFPVSLLDEIGKLILLETNIRQNDETLLAHFLGALEFSLRKRRITIRWAVLQEIDETMGSHLEKKDIYKWMYYTRQRKKDHVSDTLSVIQHLVIETVFQESLSPEYKRQLCLQIVQSIKDLRKKGFVCKDPEIAAWSLKRILLQEKGSQVDIPKEFRAATTRMTFRLRKILKHS
ncbi:MAG: hypothetical protein ACFFC7_21705 [Candidatus Hermodarchaeota archaeon]